MSQGLKRRLIGAIVLVAVLIMSAPALFHGGNSHPLIVADMVPPNPTPAEPAIVKQLDTPADPISTEVIAEKPVADPDEQPGLDKEGHLKAWSLQVASFLQKKNAAVLRQKLLSKGYNAYTRKQVREKRSPLYRVYVGPQARTDELKAAQADLEKTMGLAGIIVRYQP
ncbi:SPOR domain-containing protein [Candidatus Sororendozoicomonas aggregata]|uniref:SPOR domain-containing protein n=1 Tax=Candidatus Sororendozoicomonas aggregata TaxID=3073239 RepID=UPI002ED67864